MCVCVSVRAGFSTRGLQIGLQKTPSDLSGLHAPTVRICVCVCGLMWRVCVTGALVLYGTMVITGRQAGDLVVKEHACVSVRVCVFQTPTFHLALYHGCCDVTHAFSK